MLESPADWRIFDRKIRQWITLAGHRCSLEEEPPEPQPPETGDRNNSLFILNYEKTAKKREQYQESKEKAIEGIKSRLSENPFDEVSALPDVQQTPLLILEYLKEHYSPSGYGALTDLAQEFYTINLDMYENVQKYADRFKAIVNELRNLGKNAELPPVFIILRFLQGLSSAYDNFQSTLQQTTVLMQLDDQVEKAITFSEIVKRAENEERRLKQAGITTMYNKTGNQNLACSHCKRKGHKMENCWNKYPEKRHPSMKKSPGKRKFNSSKDYENSKNMKNEEDKATFIAQLCNGSEILTYQSLNTQPDWYLDTASQSHVADERGHFTIYKQFPVVTQYCKGIGGHRLPIVGVGQIEVFTRDPNGKRRGAIFRNVLHCPDLGANLISFAQLQESSKSIAINAQGFICESKNGSSILFKRINGMYRLDAAEPSSTSKS